MINFTRTPLLSLEVDAIVNPVNCQGVSGAGLAKVFAEKYPEGARKYRCACEDGSLDIGTYLLFTPKVGPTIIYLPTKRHWRNQSRISYIDLGCEILTGLPFKSIGVPKLGCGLGGLNFPAVREIMVKWFEPSPIDFWVVVEEWEL